MELRDKVTQHPMSEEQIERSNKNRTTILMAMETANNTLPDGREKSLAITKLEEALMWANKAIALEGCKHG